MKRVALLFALLFLAGCARTDAFKVGDTLVSQNDGSVLGKVIEVGDHTFANGAAGPSVHVKLEAGGDAWYTSDTTVASYRVKP